LTAIVETFKIIISSYIMQPDIN